MKKLTRSDIIFNNEMVKQFGQQKACEQGKSFSRYVSDLVEKDLDINYNAVKRDFEKEKTENFSFDKPERLSIFTKRTIKQDVLVHLIEGGFKEDDMIITEDNSAYIAGSEIFIEYLDNGDIRVSFEKNCNPFQAAYAYGILASKYYNSLFLGQLYQFIYNEEGYLDFIYYPESSEVIDMRDSKTIENKE